MKHSTHHDEHPHILLSKSIKRFKKQLIVVAVFVAMSLATLTAVLALLAFQDNRRLMEQQAAAREQAAIGIAQAPSVKPTSAAKVTSTLGFSLTYNPSLITAKGTVGGDKTISKQQLEQPRSYDTVTFSRPQSSLPGGLGGATLTINTSNRADFWTELQGRPAYVGMNQSTRLQSYVLDELQTADIISISEPEAFAINGIDYQRVVVMQDGSEYGIKSPITDIYYFVVQNNRPYWVVMTNVEADAALTAVFKSVLSSITYPKLTTQLSSHTGSNIAAVRTAITTLPDDTSNVPDPLDEDTLLNVVVRNQPAVVRILTLGCSTVNLRSGSASVTFPDTCQGGVGSGSIISADGYIGTNGHVVSLQPSAYASAILRSRANIAKLFAYFVSARIVTQQQANNILDGLKSGDPQAIRALANVPKLITDKSITLDREEVQYAVQLSNQPMRISSDQEISFNDTVVSASLIAKNYDGANAEAVLKGKAQFTHSDIAILKAEGSYPAVELGDTDQLEAGDQLTAIGFPGFVDGDIATTQFQTIPTVTQGSVLDIVADAPGSERQLIRTNVQIAQGNSGGPSFDDEGYQIGLNTYGRIECSDAQCFGNGTIRDVADLKQLLKANGITPQTGDIQKNWDDALDSYESGDYKTALKLFEKTQRDYPANYLASELASDARKRVGSETDTSGANEARETLIVVLVVVLLAGIGLIVGIIFTVIHLNKKHKHLLPPPPMPPLPPTQVT